jgi:hypothetical protein
VPINAPERTRKEAEAWRQVLMSNPSSGDVALAREDLLTWEELTDADQVADQPTLIRMRQVLGIGGKAGLPVSPAPSTLARELGIW